MLGQNPAALEGVEKLLERGARVNLATGIVTKSTRLETELGPFLASDEARRKVDAATEAKDESETKEAASAEVDNGMRTGAKKRRKRSKWKTTGELRPTVLKRMEKRAARTAATAAPKLAGRQADAVPAAKPVAALQEATVTATAVQVDADGPTETSAAEQTSSPTGMRQDLELRSGAELAEQAGTPADDA